jgi:hypothetical protein
MKLNLELVENRAKSALPQAKDPREMSLKAPWTKGNGNKADNKTPKSERAKLAQPEYKSMNKYSAKPKPLKVDSPNAGKPESAPKYSTMKGASKFEKMKDVKKPGAPTVKKSSAALPDASSVSKRGLMGADAGEASLDFKNKVTKVSLPSSAKKLDIAPAKIAKPDLGWGLLKPGKIMDKLGNVTVKMTDVKKPAAPEVKKSKAAIPQFKESVINGRVELRVGGRLKAVFEAATPKMLAIAASDYTKIGANVQLTPIIRGRNLYSDKRFSMFMIEAVHAEHHNVSSKAARNSAFKRLVSLTENERDPRIHKTRRSWIKEAAFGAFRQAKEEYVAAYNNLLERYDVVVGTDRGSRRFITMATDNRHAAALAMDMALSSDIQASITHAFVGGKKFLPEGKGGSLFMRFPKPFGELVNGTKMNKSEMGVKAEPKIGKVPELKLGSGSVKGVAKIKDGDKGGEKSSLVDKDGSKFKLGKALSNPPVPKDKGPVYEARRKQRMVEDVSQRVINMLKDAAAKFTGKNKRMMEELAEKVNSNEDVSGKESKILDKIIKLALKHN